MFSDCSLSDRYVVSLILAVLSIIFSIIMDYGIYKAVQHYKNCDDDNKPPKAFFLIGLFLVMISSITMMIFSILLIIRMIDCNQEIKVSNWLFSISYAFQIYCLHLLWLNRLKFVFHGTVYQISPFISIAYIICLLITWIAAMSLLIFVPFISRWIIYSSLYALSSIFLMILIFIFIYKLQKLYNATNNGAADNSDLISLITRTIILAFVSIFCTLLLSLMMIINIWIDMVYTVLLIDIITNALCVMLTYSYYDNTYYKLCGFLHNKCLLIYASIYHHQQQKEIDNIRKHTDNMIKLSVNDEESNHDQKKESPMTPIHRITILKQLSMASILSDHKLFKSNKLSASHCKSPSRSPDTLMLDIVSPMSDLMISTIDESEESDDKNDDFIQHSLPLSVTTINSTAL